jgi:hypothetical protein
MQRAPVAPAPSGAALERELKFILPEAQAAGTLTLLRALCRPDPRYRTARVSTIYYDTPGLQLLGEKLDSDYLKLKVRLRWYESDRGDATSFLELKSRVGALRHKERVATPLEARWLDTASLEDPALVDVLSLAAPLGRTLPMPLTPAVLVRYTRHRFVDPVSGARVSLDTGIEARCARRGLFHAGAGVNLGAAVLEIKGQSDDLPRALRPLAHLGMRRGSFSKYANAAREVLRAIG